jgi:hypothetical protein
MLFSLLSCYYGAARGYRAEPFNTPIKANSIARKVPSQPMYLHLKFLMPLFGALTFASLFVEF